MPAAAAKIEKPAAASGEVTNGKGKIASSNNINSTIANAFQDPQKIASTIIEKKVRNLEKRKARLLEIKGLEDKGQQLEAEQKIAVKKLDSVVEMIDMLKEIGKNVNDGLNDFAKQLKKQQKREQLEKQTERQQQDAERTKLWLNAQFILSRLAPAKNDLLQGENGALKLEESQVEALEKLVELLSPSSVELMESSVEKVNFLLEGNKREFTTGVTYSVLKETFVKLIDSKYFETVSVSTTAPANNNQQAIISSDDKEESPKVESSEPVPPAPVTTVPSHNDSQEKPVQEQVQVKQQPQQQQPVQQQQHQQSNVHQLNQLCFMRDPIVENELQHKDPAVVAVGASGFAYQPQLGQGMPVSSGANIVTSGTMSYHYSPHMNPAVSIGSIPTQTFTNPNYNTIIPPNQQYIPVTLSAQIPHHQMPIHEQTLPIRNVTAPEVSPVLTNDKIIDHQSSASNEQFSTDGSPKEASNLLASQDSEGKPAVNGTENGNYGHHKRYNRGGRGAGGNPRGNFGGNPNNNGGGGGSFRGGRGGKSFGNGGPGQGGANFFNGGGGSGVNNAHQNGGGNFNPNRPTNNARQNGGGNRSGPYRQDRGGVYRNQNFNNNNNNSQGAPVSAK